MYYFIPSWYGSGRQWHADITPWYFSFFKLEFDDTFNQIRLFQRQEITSHLMILAYHPHLRYFLHRHGVLEASVYSVFDDMQDLHDPHVQVLNMWDIEWDKECEFLYSPFAITVYKQGKRYAQVEHGTEGFISDIQYFHENGQLLEHYIMDDRGFVSSVIYFKDGAPSYQDYLNLKGIWQFREYLQEDGRVEVNPIFSYQYKKTSYKNIGELIAEFFERKLLQQYKADDIYILPSHDKHNEFVLSRLPENSTKILSLFIGRNPQESLSELGIFCKKVDLVLVDREDSLQQLQNLYPEKNSKFQHLSPFDTRLRLGKSQRKKESIIYFHLNFEEGLDEEGIYEVLSYVAKTDDTELVFGTFAANQEQMSQVEELVQDIISKRIHVANFEKELDYGEAENPLEENENQNLRYQFINMYDESDLIKNLEYVRLIIDLSIQPHLYTQIAAISAGIPQINRVKTVYVEHLKNGYLLSEVSELHKAMSHYLDTLKEWNQSLIYTIDKIKEHTGKRFLEKLHYWIGEVTNGEGT